MNTNGTIRSARDIVAIATEYGYMLTWRAVRRGGCLFYRIFAIQGVRPSPYPTYMHSRPVQWCTIKRFIDKGILSDNYKCKL